MRMTDGEEWTNFDLVEKAAKFQKVVTEKGTGVIVSYSPAIDYNIFCGLLERVETWAKRFGVDKEDILVLPEIVDVKFFTRAMKKEKKRK